jgi:predicted protein tyrosine phosphatase
MESSPPLRNVLFTCRANRSRSATAERIYAKRADWDVRSARTSADALVRVNRRMLDWADTIFIMDPEQRDALESMFPGHPALGQLSCLDIPDDYLFLQPELWHRWNNASNHTCSGMRHRE